MFTTRRKPKITWQDVVRVHRTVAKGLYRSEEEIFQREAELLNKILLPRRTNKKPKP